MTGRCSSALVLNLTNMLVTSSGFHFQNFVYMIFDVVVVAATVGFVVIVIGVVVFVVAVAVVVVFKAVEVLQL